MKKYFIKIPKNVQLLYNSTQFSAIGPLGKEHFQIPKNSTLEFHLKNDKLEILELKGSLKTKKVNQTVINLIQQIVKGVLTGYRTQLELKGIGYRAQLYQDKLELKLGFSHLILKSIPPFLKVVCPKPTLILIQGTNCQKINEFRSSLQTLRFPEHYKGKGLFYKNQTILRKQGKKS